MKLKQFAIILCSIGLLMACSEEKEAAQEESSNEKEEQAEEKEESGIEVDKGLLNVELTLPEELFEEDELDEIKEEMKKDHNGDIKQNDDGSLSVKMSKK